MSKHRRRIGMGGRLTATTTYRYRVKYKKTGEQKWLSHLDTVRAFERGLRRAGLPVALTGGYSPHPKLSFGQALALGIESRAEYADLEMATELSEAELVERINRVMPAALSALESKKLGSKSLSLGKTVKFATYRLEFKFSEIEKVKKEILKAIRLTGGIIKFKSESGDGEIFIHEVYLGNKGGIAFIDATVPINTNPRRLFDGINSISEGSLANNKITRVNQWLPVNDRLVDPIENGTAGSHEEKT